MVMRFVRLAVLAAPFLVAQSAMAGHFTCRVTLDDDDGGPSGNEPVSEFRFLAFKLLESGSGTVDVQVASTKDQGGTSFQTKFKNVPLTKTADGGYVVGATPEQAVDSEPAGCNTRQYFFNFNLKPKGDNFSADIEITPFYKKGEQNGKCIAFAAPELITESHRNANCLHAD